jgi:hypothetical protein
MTAFLTLAAFVVDKATPAPAAPARAVHAVVQSTTTSPALEIHHDNHNTGWVLGFVFFGVVVAAVVALVVPILLLANKIGKQAPGINASLQESLENTAGLGGLETTIDHATEIIGGLTRARLRLGG